VPLCLVIHLDLIHVAISQRTLQLIAQLREVLSDLLLLRQKWIGLDATRAPNGFGAGHITMAVGNGDPADFFAMANTLGYFKIEKVTMGK